MYKKSIIVGSITSAVAVVLVFVVQCVPEPNNRIDPENAYLIEAGMSQRQVEELLAAPPGDYSTDPEAFPTDMNPNRIGIGVTKSEWKSDYCLIHVWFDDGDEVSAMECYPSLRKREQSIFARVLVHLGWAE
jgi:hypothetical protein